MDGGYGEAGAGVGPVGVGSGCSSGARGGELAMGVVGSVTGKTDSSAASVGCGDVLGSEVGGTVRGL